MSHLIRTRRTWTAQSQVAINTPTARERSATLTLARISARAAAIRHKLNATEIGTEAYRELYRRLKILNESYFAVRARALDPETR